MGRLSCATALFSAVEVAEGKQIGQCMSRRRCQVSIRFFKLRDAKRRGDWDAPEPGRICTHEQPRVRSWLQRHPPEEQVGSTVDGLSARAVGGPALLDGG